MSTKPYQRLKLLFADDEKSLQELMRLELPRLGHEVTVCPDGAYRHGRPGPQYLRLPAGRSRHAGPRRPGGHRPGQAALRPTPRPSSSPASRRWRRPWRPCGKGTFDYLTKPCKLADLEAVLHRVAEKRELTNKYRALKQRLQRLEGSSELIGDSPGMQLVRRLIAKVAPTNSTVLILGETGTGKELVARALHDQSLRAEMPLVPVNCGALPENLIESELFGHRKGAFTGAEEHRTGLFEVAHGGTLFLDEIGELPKSMQAKLLRFLESGEVRRVGDNESFTCDVRVLCATNRRLDDDGGRRRVPRGPLVSHQHLRDSAAAVARADGRRAACWPGTWPRRHGAPAGRDDEILLPEALAALGAAHLAGQRPRVGQRDRTRLDSLRRRADRARASAAAVCRAAVRCPLRPKTLPAVNLRDLEMQAIQRGPGPSRGQQAQGGRGAGHQPEDALQQAEPGGGAGEVGVSGDQRGRSPRGRTRTLCSVITMNFPPGFASSDCPCGLQANDTC